MENTFPNLHVLVMMTHKLDLSGIINVKMDTIMCTGGVTHLAGVGLLDIAVSH